MQSICSTTLPLVRPRPRRASRRLGRVGLGAAVMAMVLLSGRAGAQERPYFVTYTHQLEEPGSLEVSFNSALGSPKSVPGFLSSWVELEYGVKGWWTSEFYLDGQATRRDSTVFTGYRWENRFRPFLHEHWINPILYVEFSNTNGADKTLREVVGFDSEKDFAHPNAEARREKKREFETKLILSSYHRGWNFSENFIAEKNLAAGPWEFGYAVGASRPLALAASAKNCTFCRENFQVGVEFYGGLGDALHFTLSRTSHYVAPVLSWELPRGTTVRFSPGFGLTPDSHRFLLRFGISYEIAGFGRRVSKLFH
jgi:hypothetical protein